MAMFILGNFVQTLALIVDKVLWIYNWIVIVAVLITWVNPDPFNPIVRFLRGVTQPVFEWVRARLPFVVMGMMDLSPLVLLLALQFLRMFLARTLLDLSMHLR